MLSFHPQVSSVCSGGCWDQQHEMEMVQADDVCPRPAPCIQLQGLRIHLSLQVQYSVHWNIPQLLHALLSLKHYLQGQPLTSR